MVIFEIHVRLSIYVADALMRNFPLLGGATPSESISTAACSLLSVRRRKTTMPQRQMAPRRLFQDENQANDFTEDNTANALLEELKKSSEEAKAKWNFDFANEQPLEGNWEWERIESPNSKETELNQNATNEKGCA